MAVYHANLGGSCRALKQWDEAEKAYQNAVKLEPDKAEYQNLLGNVYFETGRFQESIPFYKRAAESSPDVTVYHANLGGSYRALKHGMRQRRAYQNAVKLEPDKAEYQTCSVTSILEVGDSRSQYPFIREPQKAAQTWQFTMQILVVLIGH